MTNQASFGRRGVAAEPPRRRIQTELAGPVEVVITRRGASKGKINERPRRTLLYQTSAEKFAECVAAIG